MAMYYFATLTINT